MGLRRQVRLISSTSEFHFEVAKHNAAEKMEWVEIESGPAKDLSEIGFTGRLTKVFVDVRSDIWLICYQRHAKQYRKCNFFSMDICVSNHARSNSEFTRKPMILQSTSGNTLKTTAGVL